MSTNAMHVAKTGLNAQQVRMQVIANNLSNVNTTGFKRDRANFETLLYQVMRNSGDQTSAETNLSSAFAVGTGTRIVNSDKLFSPLLLHPFSLNCQTADLIFIVKCVSVFCSEIIV